MFIHCSSAPTMLMRLNRRQWHLAELRCAPGSGAALWPQRRTATAREGASPRSDGTFITHFYYCQTQPLHSGQELMNHDSLLHLQNAKHPGEKK